MIFHRCCFCQHSFGFWRNYIPQSFLIFSFVSIIVYVFWKGLNNLWLTWNLPWYHLHLYYCYICEIHCTWLSKWHYPHPRKGDVNYIYSANLFDFVVLDLPQCLDQLSVIVIYVFYIIYYIVWCSGLDCYFFSFYNFFMESCKCMVIPMIGDNMWMENGEQN